MISPPVRRIATGILALWLVAFAAWARPVSADTNDRAPITINIFSSGTRDISWTNAPVAFLVEGQPPTLTAAAPSVVAEAAFTLEVSDSLPDGARPGYTIAISAGAFTSEGVSTTISPAMLSIEAISGIPTEYANVTAIGARLDSQVTILTVPDGAAAISTVLTITIEMTLSPGLMEGEYSGTITADILPISWDAP